MCMLVAPGVLEGAAHARSVFTLLGTSPPPFLCRWNQLIHFIFVPTIVWTICVWLSYPGSLLKAIGRGGDGSEGAGNSLDKAWDELVGRAVAAIGGPESTLGEMLGRWAQDQ